MAFRGSESVGAGAHRDAESIPDPANLDPDHTDEIPLESLEAARAAYEDAGIRGLCAEGRRECAIEAMRRLDPESIASQASADESAASDDRRPRG